MLRCNNYKINLIYLTLLLSALLSFALPRKVDAQVATNEKLFQSQELSLIEYYLGPITPGRKNTRRFFITLKQLHSLCSRRPRTKTV